MELLRCGIFGGFGGFGGFGVFGEFGGFGGFVKIWNFGRGVNIWGIL